MSWVRCPVCVLAVVAIGLLAGVLVGTGMTALTAKGLPEGSWTMRFQLEDALFARTMPPSFIATLLLLIGAAVLTRGIGRGFFAVAALLMVVALAVTVAGEVPLNKQVQSWTAGAAPPVWAAVRERWFFLHLLRTLAGVASFICATVGLSRT